MHTDFAILPLVVGVLFKIVKQHVMSNADYCCESTDDTNIRILDKIRESKFKGIFFSGFKAFGHIIVIQKYDFRIVAT